MRELSIHAGKEDCFKVISKKYKKDKLIQTDIYKTDLRHNYCDCKGFWFRHDCIHIRTIKELLKAKGIGIVWNKTTDSYYTNWDYQEIEKLIKDERVKVK